MQSWYARLKSYGMIVLGTLLVALAVDLFLAPNHLAVGGVSGIATALHFLMPLSIGTFSILLNVPLFLAGMKREGKRFAIQSFVGALLLSIWIDLCSIIPPVTNDLLLASLFGGILSGIGLGLVFLQGSTTGGSDIMAKLLQRLLRHRQLGNLIFCIDVIIIAFATIVFRDVQVGMYSVIALFASSWMIDTMIDGVGFAKLIYIVSDVPSQITEAINQSLQRGATTLRGKGTYSKQKKEIILCTVKRHEIPRVKDIVRLHDPNAFVIVTDAREVVGEGFLKM